MGINKWRSREKQERAVRVERAREDVCRRVFVRRARVIDSACSEAIDQQYDEALRHGALRCTLDDRFGQSGVAMERDDRWKRAIPVRFSKKPPKPVTWHVIRDLPTFPGTALLQAIKSPRGSLEFDQLRRRCNGVDARHSHRAAKHERDCG